MEEKEIIPLVTINKLVFNNGEEIELDRDDIVVFVGGNNVGKSRTLKEINNDIKQTKNNKILLKSIEYKEHNFNNNSLLEYAKKNLSKDRNGDYCVYTSNNTYNSYKYNDFSKLNPNCNTHLYKMFITYISTDDRLLYSVPSYDIANVMSVYSKLDKDEEKISKLNKYMYKAFGDYIDVYYDIENGIQKYKIGSKEEMTPILKLARRKALNRLAELLNLDDQGDGVRSGFSILSQLIAKDSSIYLIDEPETSLHPPQARMMGKNIVKLTEGKQVLLSTHNIDIIRGILEEKTSRVKIIKIDRDGNSNSFNQLNNRSINTIARDKNLKYTNILNGLFYKQVVLCEDESDCKFYSAILEELNDDIYQNTLFCAVGGKDQFKKIAPLLTKLSINYKIIADLDLINNENTLSSLLESIKEKSYEPIMEDHQLLLTKYNSRHINIVKTQCEIKKEINEIFTEEEYMTDQTIKQIKEILKKANILGQLKNYGEHSIPRGECTKAYLRIKKYLKDHNIYMPECGEIENFIQTISSHGDKWVEEVFIKYPKMDEEEYKDAKNFIKSVFDIS